MSAETQEYLEMAYHEDELLLQVQWLRNVSSEEYRAGVIKVKELLLEKQANFLLIDSRRLPNVCFADQQWIKREIVPCLIPTKLQKFARVLTKDIFNYISFEILLQRITEEHKTSIEIGQFISVEAALAWIRMD